MIDASIPLGNRATYATNPPPVHLSYEAKANGMRGKAKDSQETWRGFPGAGIQVRITCENSMIPNLVTPLSRADWIYWAASKKARVVNP